VYRVHGVGLEEVVVEADSGHQSRTASQAASGDVLKDLEQELLARRRFHVWSTA